MNNIINIADINMLVKTPFSYDIEDVVIKNFIVENLEPDIYYNFKFLEYKPKFKSKAIYDNAIIKLYYENNKFYRELYFSKEGTEYALLEDNGDYYNCYIYPNCEWVYKKNSRLILRSMAIESSLIKFNAIMLHSSFINWDNNGILFSGPSGIGKSTQADLWNKYKNAKIINGDRAIIRKIDGKWKAYGSPYAGSSQVYINESCILKSIVILRQSMENKVTELDSITAFKTILQEVTINHYDLNYYNKAIDILQELVKEVPVILLECRPDEGAVNLLQKSLIKI